MKTKKKYFLCLNSLLIATAILCTSCGPVNPHSEISPNITQFVEPLERVKFQIESTGRKFHQLGYEPTDPVMVRAKTMHNLAVEDMREVSFSVTNDIRKGLDGTSSSTDDATNKLQRSVNDYRKYLHEQQNDTRSIYKAIRVVLNLIGYYDTIANNSVASRNQAAREVSDKLRTKNWDEIQR